MIRVGVAQKHLRTLERVPVNKKLLTGTVPVNNLFLKKMSSVWTSTFKNIKNKIKYGHFVDDLIRKLLKNRAQGKSGH